MSNTLDYEYLVNEKSITLDALSRYVFDPIVKQLPETLSPNTISWCGMICVVLSSVFVALQCFEVVSFGGVFAAVLLFLYMCADNIDGKQARKTGQSSKYGEFLDHYLDSISFIFVNASCALLLGLSDWLLIGYICAISLAFYATIWEQHNTGVFQSGLVGTNEALLMTSGLFVLAGIIPEASWLYYNEVTWNLAYIVATVTIAISMITFIAAINRVRAHWFELTTFVALLFALCVLVYSEQLAFTHAMFLMLGSNAVMCGGKALEHLADSNNSTRLCVIWMVSVFFVVLGGAGYYGYSQEVFSSTILAAIAAGVGSMIILVIVHDFNAGKKALAQ